MARFSIAFFALLAVVGCSSHSPSSPSTDATDVVAVDGNAPESTGDSVRDSSDSAADNAPETVTDTHDVVTDCQPVAWGSVVGTYRGVPAYSNHDHTSVCGDDDSAAVCNPSTCTATGCGILYQCVEYAERFYHVLWATLQTEYGVRTGVSDCDMRGSGNASDLFACTSNDCLRALSHFPNGSTTPPQPDDILAWGPSPSCPDGGTCNWGHVAIVRSVTRDPATGLMTRLTVIEQNVSDTTCDGGQSIDVNEDDTGAYWADTQSGIGAHFAVQGWIGLR